MYTMNCLTSLTVVALSLLWLQTASGAQHLPLTVIPNEEGQCPSPGGADAVNGILQEVSTLLQDVVCRRFLGSTPEYAGISCAEIAEQKPNCPSGNYYVLNSTGSAVQVYCEMGDIFPDNLNLKNGWVRVANLNLTSPEQQCPDSLTLHTSPVRACAKRTDGDICDSVTFTTYGIQYQQVCGRVRGYQFNTPGAFHHLTSSCSTTCNDIDQTYVDGVSITHGHPRQHVWTYAAGVSEMSTSSSCPCAGGSPVPVFVGSDYYCESGHAPIVDPVVYIDDPLWDGQDCGRDEGTCCDSPNLPWFCKELPQPTIDDLEVRICMDQDLLDENVFMDLLELYIQ